MNKLNNGIRNTGIENSGNGNSGDFNKGSGNSGDKNKGGKNSGSRNKGFQNSGDGNVGNCNSGSLNNGHENSGCRNNGYCNTGYENHGNSNSGSRNNGNENSGYGNSCNRSSGIFCTETPQLYCFNKPTEKTWDDIDHPEFDDFHLIRWIPQSEMTAEEEQEYPEFQYRKGYLKIYSWQEAWANYWRDSSEEEKQKVLNLPNFDADIFREITGINVNAGNSLNGKIAEIDGKSYRLSEVK